MLIALDFAPGLHGHFLEFIVNKFIYGVPSDNQNIFQSSGAVHKINVDSQYQQKKMVHCGHYTSFNYNYPSDTHQIIFIDHTSELDIVLLTNVYHRCHPESMNTDDFDINKIQQLHRSMLLADSDLQCRNNWFAKLNEGVFKDQLLPPTTDIPVHFFNYTSFFNLIDFCTELKKLARFLGETFTFDLLLSAYWTEFIEKNQGWKLHKLGNSLLQSALCSIDVPIPDDWKLHAYLNFKLSKVLDIHDGILFTNPVYPDTTLKLASIIHNHITSSK